MIAGFTNQRRGHENLEKEFNLSNCDKRNISCSSADTKDAVFVCNADYVFSKIFFCVMENSADLVWC